MEISHKTAFKFNTEQVCPVGASARRIKAFPPKRKANINKYFIKSSSVNGIYIYIYLLS